MRTVSNYHPMTFEKACNALFLVKIIGLKQTTVANMLDLNVGSVSHVVNGHRFPGAFPVPPKPNRHH